LKLALAVGVWIGLSQLALAGPPTEHSVHRLLELTHAEATWAAVPNALQRLTDDRLRATLSNASFTDDERTQLQNARNEIVETIRRELAWIKVRSAIVRMYVETFEQDEITALVHFYSSDAGRAYVSRMPAVREQMAKFGNMQAQALQPELEKAIQRALNPPSRVPIK
jgi:hypothetical protein